MLGLLIAVYFHQCVLGAEEHAFQQFIECGFNSQWLKDSWKYGFDGRDIMRVDFASENVVATSEYGKGLAEERKSMEYIKKKEERLNIVCSAVKTVFLKSNNTLSRAAKPAVFLSLEEEQGQQYLKCAVHGFYPNVIQVRWTRNGKSIYFGGSTTGILPHRDGTFQMTSYLSLHNLTTQEVMCEVEHISIGKLRKTYEKKKTTAAVTAFVFGFIISMFLTIVFWKKQTTKPSTNEADVTLDESEESLNSRKVCQEC